MTSKERHQLCRLKVGGTTLELPLRKGVQAMDALQGAFEVPEDEKAEFYFHPDCRVELKLTTLNTVWNGKWE